MIPEINTTEDILAYLDSIPTVSTEDLHELEKTIRSFDDNPAFQADYYKGLFVNSVLDGMAKHSLSQSEVSRRWGKTRQYLHRILDESAKVNFTIETMVELAMVVGKRFKLELTDALPTAVFVKMSTPRRLAVPLASAHSSVSSIVGYLSNDDQCLIQGVLPTPEVAASCSAADSNVLALAA